LDENSERSVELLASSGSLAGIYLTTIEIMSRVSGGEFLQWELGDKHRDYGIELMGKSFGSGRARRNGKMNMLS
jgi:hypothetical protein